MESPSLKLSEASYLTNELLHERSIQTPRQPPVLSNDPSQEGSTSLPPTLKRSAEAGSSHGSLHSMQDDTRLVLPIEQQNLYRNCGYPGHKWEKCINLPRAYCTCRPARDPRKRPRLPTPTTSIVDPNTAAGSAINRDQAEQLAQFLPVHQHKLCWRCGYPGHHRSKCDRPPRLFCSRCGKLGIMSSKCPCGRRSDVPLPPTPDLPLQPPPQKRMKPQKVRLLVSTGVQCDLIRVALDGRPLWNLSKETD